MKWYQVKAVSLIVLCCLGGGNPSYADEPNGSGEHNAESGTGGRSTSDKAKVSPTFDELIKFLEEQKAGSTIVYQFKKEAEENAASVTLDADKILDLKKQIEAVKAYANKLVKCNETATEDKVSSELLKTLNQFLDFIKDQKVIGKFDSKGTVKEKELNTLVVRIQKALEDKATKFKAGIKEFEKADKDLSSQLVSIVKIIQGGTWDKKVVDEKQIEEDSVRKAIKDSKEESKMCKLDEVATESQGTQSSQSGTTNSASNDNSQPVPPVVDPSIGGGNPGAQLPGAQTPGVFTPPNQVPIADPSLGGFQNNQLQAALDALRRATDDRDRDREIQDELLRRQFDDQNNDSAQALRALQGALGQAQRPNVSRGNSDRSEQGPQISPSVSIPPSQQQPFQPQPMPQLPPPPPFPMGALANNGPAQPILPYTPSRFNDDIPSRPAVPQPDPTTAALLQTMQQQNQMFQQMMMNRGPYPANGVANVNGTVGNAFQNFAGPRFSRGATGFGPRVMPSRFRGNARSGIQGRMGANPSARGQIPSRLGR